VMCVVFVSVGWFCPGVAARSDPSWPWCVRPWVGGSNSQLPVWGAGGLSEPPPWQQLVPVRGDSGSTVRPSANQTVSSPRGPSPLSVAGFLKAALPPHPLSRAGNHPLPPACYRDSRDAEGLGNPPSEPQGPLWPPTPDPPTGSSHSECVSEPPARGDARAAPSPRPSAVPLCGAA